MSMTGYAKNEIEIACKKERGDKASNGGDCGCACYEERESRDDVQISCDWIERLPYSERIGRYRKMSMIWWAKKEVELALTRESVAIENDPDENDEGMKNMRKQYASGCYASALKAYKSLMDDDHSGYSFSVTQGILKRLLDGYPLTPIEDIPESWNLIRETEEVQEYQCRRCSSLFKDVDKKTGESTFSDVERIVCTSKDGTCWTNGFVTRKISELYPIKMPYWPTGRCVVSAFDFAVDGTPGVFDTMEIKSVKFPDGKIDVLDWHYKEVDGQFVPITPEEYTERYRQYLDNIKNRAKDIDNPEDDDNNDQAETI